MFTFLLEALQSILASLFETLWEIGVNTFGKETPERKSHFLSSRTLLRRRWGGFCLDGRRQLRLKHSFQHVMITGSSGAGKSSAVVIPSILQSQGSFIVHDPSGELFLTTQKALRRRGYKVQNLAFGLPGTEGYNPLQAASSLGGIKRLAQLLVRSGLGDQDAMNFWNLSAQSVLTLLMQLQKAESLEEMNLQSLRRLVGLLGSYPVQIKARIEAAKQRMLLEDLLVFLAYDSKVQQGIVATCRAALDLFEDPHVAELTRLHTVDFEAMRKKKMALFLRTPIGQGEYYRVLREVFLEQCLQSFLRSLPGIHDLPVFLIIDEAASLHIPSLPLALVNLRKMKVGLMLVLQSEAQLIDLYGQSGAATIIGNAWSKLYFTGQDLPTSEKLSKIAGVDEEGFPLLTADQIRRLPEQTTMLLAGNYPPLLLRMKPYYTTRLRRQIEV